MTKTKEPTIQKTIYIPESLFEKIKKRAQEQARPINYVINEALVNLFKTKNKK